MAHAEKKYPNCDVQKVTVLKACSQVVAGTNYEYVARAKMDCAGKEEVHYVWNKFLKPLPTK